MQFAFDEKHLKCDEAQKVAKNPCRRNYDDSFYKEAFALLSQCPWYIRQFFVGAKSPWLQQGSRTHTPLNYSADKERTQWMKCKCRFKFIAYKVWGENGINEEESRLDNTKLGKEIWISTKIFCRMNVHITSIRCRTMLCDGFWSLVRFSGKGFISVLLSEIFIHLHHCRFRQWFVLAFAIHSVADIDLYQAWAQKTQESPRNTNNRCWATIGLVRSMNIFHLQITCRRNHMLHCSAGGLREFGS